MPSKRVDSWRLNSDGDVDGDGVVNEEDQFPEDSTEKFDLDGNGVGDNEDDDADGDGIPTSENADDLDTTIGRLSSGQNADGGESFSYMTFILPIFILVLLIFLLRQREEEEAELPEEGKTLVVLGMEEE